MDKWTTGATSRLKRIELSISINYEFLIPPLEAEKLYQKATQYISSLNNSKDAYYRNIIIERANNKKAVLEDRDIEVKCAANKTHRITIRNGYISIPHKSLYIDGKLVSKELQGTWDDPTGLPKCLKILHYVKALRDKNPDNYFRALYKNPPLKNYLYAVYSIARNKNKSSLDYYESVVSFIFDRIKDKKSSTKIHHLPYYLSLKDWKAWITHVFLPGYSLIYINPFGMYIVNEVAELDESHIQLVCRSDDETFNFIIPRRKENETNSLRNLTIRAD